MHKPTRVLTHFRKGRRKLCLLHYILFRNGEDSLKKVAPHQMTRFSPPMDFVLSKYIFTVGM